MVRNSVISRYPPFELSKFNCIENSTPNPREMNGCQLKCILLLTCRHLISRS